MPTFDSNEDPTERCARCIPVQILGRQKVIKHTPESFAANFDLFDFTRQFDGWFLISFPEFNVFISSSSNL
jgi:hypothetical protein